MRLTNFYLRTDRFSTMNKTSSAPSPVSPIVKAVVVYGKKT